MGIALLLILRQLHRGDFQSVQTEIWNSNNNNNKTKS